MDNERNLSFNETEGKMSKSAKSVFVFGIYLFVLGIVLLVIPNVLLSLFGFQETSEVWIRVVGMLIFILAFYYTTAARKEVMDFFRITVYGRGSVIVFFIIFVVLKLAEPMLILFGVIDLLGAIWTQLTLRSSKSV